MHYCGDDIAEIAVISELSGNSCSCETADELGSCCQEKSFEYQVKTEHLGQVAIENPTPPLFKTLGINQPRFSLKSVIRAFSIIPPHSCRQETPPIRIMNCVFRV